MAYRQYDVTARTEGLRNTAFIAWLCYAIGLLSAWLTGPIGFIIALVKRNDARGTMYESHFDAIIRGGLICFFGYIVGGLLTFVFIGFPILFAVWIYNVYIVVRGLMRLSERRPYD